MSAVIDFSFLNKIQEEFLLLKPSQFSSWPLWFSIGLGLAVTIGLEVLSILVLSLFISWKRIPIKGKHLDELEFIDKFFIFTSKALTIMFVFHVVQVVFTIDTIKWSFEELNILNTLGSLVCFYLFYDFWYYLFHRFLHVRWLYPYIHKHHHRQKAPSRGSLDAMNVHPIEYLVGEYLHLLTIYLIPCHIVAVVIFIALGGILASLNHTRYDVNFLGIYSAKVHDVHHRLPESNYAQYIMIWDYLFGSYRGYNENINVKAE